MFWNILKVQIHLHNMVNRLNISITYTMSNDVSTKIDRIMWKVNISHPNIEDNNEKHATSNKLHLNI